MSDHAEHLRYIAQCCDKGWRLGDNYAAQLRAAADELEALAATLDQEREQNGTTPPDEDDEPETRYSRLSDILENTWHLSDECDAYRDHFDRDGDPDESNPPARYVVLSWDGGHQQHWAVTTDETPDEIAARSGTDEGGYEECDVHDLDTGAHWSIVPTYRAVLTTDTPTTT